MLDVIVTIATGNQLAILVKTLDTLRGLAESDGAVRVFEPQALAEMAGNFQVGAIQRSDNGALSLAHGAFHFQTTKAQRRALLAAWGNEDVEFWACAQKMTLNEEQYSRHRSKVIEKMTADAADHAASLEMT